MKLLALLDRVAATPTTPAATPRRNALALLGRAAAVAVPVALAALPALASTKDTSFDAVTQLLLLERTQLALYNQALAVPGLIPAAQLSSFQRLQRHQSQHAAFLVLALQNAGALVAPVPTFDFSGRRNVAGSPVLFPNVLSSFDAFLELAQQLEDLGARLYQTQAFVIGNDPQLANAVLRMQVVEAQHSAFVRGVRRARGSNVQSWPSPTDTPIVRPAAAQVLTTAATGGEDNVEQFLTPGVPVPLLSILFLRDTGVPAAALPEAFDEPVNSAVAQAALNLFS